MQAATCTVRVRQTILMGEQKRILSYSDLRHEAVGAGALLILEDDVCVIVGDEVLEAGVLPGNTSLHEAAGWQRVLRYVRYVLLEYERGELAGPRTPARPPARSAPGR